ncbi:Valyl-tRNA synthetase [Escherichia coli]|nr:Valyl-tRNA synthetase [Escherichia coli]
MTTITKERLLAIKQWRETYGPGSNVVLPAEEAEELARIALAALEAEPVLYQSCTRPTWNSGVPWTEWKERSREGYENDLRFTDTPDHAGWINKCRKLYTTPPVPVMQADVAQAIENLKQKLVECNRYNYCADAVKGVEYACHAAMLQGSQPVSQTYKFPVNTPCQDAPAHIWLQTAGVWPEDGELSELTWCSHNQHHDDTLYVRADLVNGNYPVTPDGWISCSERMPAQDDWILIYSKHGEYMAGQVQGEYVELSDGTLSWLGNALYWMPLPEPPQEVNRG